MIEGIVDSFANRGIWNRLLFLFHQPAVPLPIVDFEILFSKTFVGDQFRAKVMVCYSEN